MNDTYRVELDDDPTYRGCHGLFGTDSCQDPGHTSMTCYLRSYDPEPPTELRTFRRWADITRPYWPTGELDAYVANRRTGAIGETSTFAHAQYLADRDGGKAFRTWEEAVGYIRGAIN